ncbi:MAG: hypothetical protein A2Y17_08150 [Clostridiales bacterium GWF2_38_85]|nr:MAG: hypothetical protein A2Y17_08150 [Clostridiales bacterium GWF2_38_85]HBL83836.1 hypothetical protein [Clostridiales bacterium]
MIKAATSSPTDSEIVERYADMLYRICITHLAAVEPSAVDDACQNVFLKYVKYSPKFKDSTHEKAWFIRCTINECKNICVYRFRRNHIPLSDIENNTNAPEGYKNIRITFYDNNPINLDMVIPENWTLKLDETLRGIGESPCNLVDIYR